MTVTVGTMTPKGLVTGVDRAGRPIYSRTTRLVTDDHGVVVCVRRCCDCRRWLELGIPNFSPNRRDKQRRIVRWSARCHGCDAREAKGRWHAKPREERSAYKRAEYERRMADPEAAADERARNRRRAAKRRQADPQLHRDYVRAYRERIRQDPERWARHLETQRMNARLRAEAERGVHLDELRRLPAVARDERMGYLPVAPLLAALEDWLGGNDMEAASAFIEMRRLYDWRKGIATRTPFDVADRVLIGIDKFWWDVWEPGVEGYEKAAELFAGEKVAA